MLYELNPVERRQFLNALIIKLQGMPSHDYRQLLTFSYAAGLRYLPDSVISAVISLREVESPGYCVINGLPIDEEVPPTPSLASGYDVCAAVPVACSVLLGMIRILGEPISFYGEYDGSSICSVMPTADSVDSVSSHGSRYLPMHTETVHLYPFSPSVVGLYCIRGDSLGEARTLLVTAADLVALCPADLLATLRKPLFWVRSPRSFGANQLICGPVSFLDGPDSHPEIRSEMTDMQGLTSEARDALSRVHDLIVQCITEVDLQAGSLLLLDNRKVLHGRNSFRARLDGSDRWLLRSLAVPDLWALRSKLIGYHQLHF